MKNLPGVGTRVVGDEQRVAGIPRVIGDERAVRRPGRVGNWRDNP